MDVTTATTTTTTSTNISGRACCPAGSENQIKQSPYAGTTVNNHNHVEHQDQNEVRREEGATSNYSKQMNERRELGNGSKASSHFKAAMSYNDDNFVKLIEMERGQQRTEDWSLMRLVESADVKLNRIHNNNNMLADKEEGKSEENSSPASDDKLTNDDTTRKPFKAVHPEPASEQATIRSLSIGGGGARRKPTTTTKLLLKSPAFSRINNKPDEEAATNSIDTTMADIDTSSVRATVLANIQAPIQDGAQEQREPMQMELSRREQPAGGGEDCLMFGRKLSCSKVEAAAAGMTTTTTTMTANMTNRQKEEASSSSSSLKRSQLGEACEEESADKPGQSLDDKQGRTRLLDQQAGNAKTVDTKDVSRAAGELERTTGRQSAVLNKNIKQSLNCAPKTDVCARTSASALEQQLKWPAAESCAGRRAAAHLNLDKSWDDEELGLDPRDGCDSDSSLSGDLRGGPTPTNDLIRALIHKDRLAFKLGNRPHGLESKMMGGRHDDNNDSAAATDRAANVAAQAHHHHCLIGEPATGDLGGSSARQMDKNHDQERDNSSGPASKSSAIKFNCLADEAAKMEASRRRSSVFDDLSGLISKCHKLQLSAAPMAEAKPAASSRQLKLSPYQQFLNRYVSPRKPSDPTELLQAKQLLDDNLNNFNRSNRRHSTYMLPILLNSRAPKPGDELSDDDADSDGSGSFGNANDLADGAGERPADGGDLSEDDLDKDMVMIAERDFKRATSAFLQRQALPNSASSPSALSTPTNENPSGGKCKCCKLDFEQEASQTAQDQTNDDDNRWGLKQSLASSRQQLSKRKRLGSNPLDRLRLLELSGRAPIGSGGGLARRSLANSLSNSSSRKSSASELSQHQTSRIPGGRARIEPATKRHSIINIFSGHHHASQQQHQHGQALVSCLSNMPRALFSSHQKIGPLIATTNADQQQYEPLIPESGFKIVVMGTSGSGKTSIIQRFMYNSFTWRHSPTVEDTYFIEFPYMKNMINISISDTSGTYQFPAMKKLAINSGDAFILVYSVDDVQSFDDLEQLRETILQEREQAYLDQANSCSSNDLSIASSGYNSVATHSIPTINFQQNSKALNGGYLHPTAGPSEHLNRPNLSPSRHWSLASLFHGHHNSGNAQAGTGNYQHHSASSSVYTSSSSQCSSTDNSRRSSVSAAEAALKTRRTRHPPMVIVANKHDLPVEQHAVNSDEIEALAVIDWNNGFVRASAALDWNINEIFQQVLKQARQPPTLAEAIVSKRRKSLPPKLPQNCHIIQ